MEDYSRGRLIYRLPRKLSYIFLEYSMDRYRVRFRVLRQHSSFSRLIRPLKTAAKLYYTSDITYVYRRKRPVSCVIAGTPGISRNTS